MDRVLARLDLELTRPLIPHAEWVVRCRGIDGDDHVPGFSGSDEHLLEADESLRWLTVDGDSQVHLHDLCPVVIARVDGACGDRE